eukprot:CAMPEP_0115735886 /NCGR_PEP_ID=MMETSP0272-20121206/86962_1 /TAXON_ID=71861 /ORGANISM="Scrippsiella trochoidea, Strain CCMP3099" /LENGTH=54 /DNA_ID=CAMNT_0003180029 /DNA_START=49 /DNA_END=209 /DNA_ORIENTATION=+
MSAHRAASSLLRYAAPAVSSSLVTSASPALGTVAARHFAAKVSPAELTKILSER